MENKGNPRKAKHILPKALGPKDCLSTKSAVSLQATHRLCASGFACAPRKRLSFRRYSSDHQLNLFPPSLSATLPPFLRASLPPFPRFPASRPLPRLRKNQQRHVEGIPSAAQRDAIVRHCLASSKNAPLALSWRSRKRGRDADLTNVPPGRSSRRATAIHFVFFSSSFFPDNWGVGRGKKQVLGGAVASLLLRYPLSKDVFQLFPSLAGARFSKTHNQ